MENGVGVSAGEGTISQEQAVAPQLAAGDYLPPSLAAGAGYLLARAGGRAISDFNRALQAHGMRSRHYTVLVVAVEDGNRSQREMGVLLGIDPSAIVAIVDDLAREGLVRREPHRDDRRSRRIVATPAGRARLTEIHTVATAINEGLLRNLDDAERRVFLDLLVRVAHG
ncbi:MarR family winged helix-turn-helix transcriptional regulator [Nonomuraea turcica]|uniref:MarR family winged helix-turn-helix transcriptional regulator n=1 Tax=Nonomuraea sp. G32 TaxID=3067274 RepID=UPI00273B25F9|nr:MarR family transcriptional regulator [Nonomuraea sp. G32]MDP4502553.1 MarR family transcriptional regulator [Nonomuraea sp. G32]